MRSDVLHKQDISDLESLLIRNGKIVPQSAATLLPFGQNALSLFCLTHGLYQLPTTELITFLQKEIGGKAAIEIGAGNGCIGRALRIPMTDNKMQTWPQIAEYYKSLQQPTVNYGSDVQEMAAIPSVQHYKPKVVIACWVTHLLKPGMTIGNAHGIDEEMMFGYGVEKYIHVGNKSVHEMKPILKRAKDFDIDVLHPDWLLSRSVRKDENCIFIIKKP